MNRQTALWQYVMTPRPQTGFEGPRSFRQTPGPNVLRWLRRYLTKS